MSSRSFSWRDLRQVPGSRAFTGLLQSVWLGGDRTILVPITNHPFTSHGRSGRVFFSRRDSSRRQDKYRLRRKHPMSFHSGSRFRCKRNLATVLRNIVVSKKRSTLMI